jgi:hypothetical protein
MRPDVCRNSQANTSRGESGRNVLTKAQSGITREATLSIGRKDWPTVWPDEQRDSSPEELMLAYTGEEGEWWALGTP